MFINLPSPRLIILLMEFNEMSEVTAQRCRPSPSPYHTSFVQQVQCRCRSCCAVMDRYLIRPAVADRESVQQDPPLQDPPPASPDPPSPDPPSPDSPKAPVMKRCTLPSTIARWKLDWLGVEEGGKKIVMFCKACRAYPPKVKQTIGLKVNDLIIGSEQIKKYTANRHQTTKQHRLAYSK